VSAALLIGGLAVAVPAAAHAGVGSGTSPAVLFNSRAPATPANMAPAADAISQPLCPALASSAFSDPFDTQTASQWQIATNASFTSLVYDSGLTTNLLILNPEPCTLAPATRYYWHVRHKDNHGMWSDWSTATWFKTVTEPFVSNVRLAQRLRTKWMDIRYDLADAHHSNLLVRIMISTNAGASFDLVPSSAWDGGADKSIGHDVQPGTNKWIVWNAGADWNNQFTTQMMVRVAASNTVATTPAGMALIPAGPFQMGDTFAEGRSGELPVHTVMVSAFYMDKREVTYTLWTSVYQWATSHGYAFDYAGSGKATNHPVQEVSWYDCAKWCNARSEKEGLTPCYYTSAVQTQIYRIDQIALSNDCVNWSANGYRLPTEAEWEKAARGGASGHRFPWSQCDTITFTNANYYSYWSAGVPYYPYDNATQSGYNPTFATGGTPYTSPAGYFAPNGYGLYDMAGNVWEWCWDWYDGAWYSAGGATQADTHGPASSPYAYRVLRGGSWYGDADGTRCAFRFSFNPGYTNGNHGFRCARGL